MLNLETAKTFFAYQDQIFDSAEMQELHEYFREKNIKQTQLNQLDKMEMITKDLKTNNALNIPLTRLSLTTQLEKNERNIQRSVKGILANDLLKAELRKLPKRNLQLINFKNQLAEALSEEKISEEAAEKFNRQINQELNRLCSESIDRLIAQDVQAIYSTGISAADLPYLNEICQFNEALRVEAENQIADYYMQTAEQQIAKNSLAASQRENALRPKNTINQTQFREDSYENPSLPALYIAETVDQINELVLNGADPLRESKDVEGTPLDHLFSASYEIEQSLNGLNIAKMCLKAELKKHLSKESELELKNQKKQLKIEAAALKHELENNAALIKAQIGVLILRKDDVEVSQYSDFVPEKYKPLWTAYKKEVLEMKQTPLSETFNVHDFLTKDLEKLPDLAPKALKSLTAKFPHYAPLLQMQSDMLANYRLVQGPSQVRLVTEPNLAIVSNQSVKASPNLSQLNVTIKPVMSYSMKDSDESIQKQSTRQKSTPRLNHSAFFGASFPATKSESVSKKVSERSSRLQASFFSTHSDDELVSGSNFGKERSTERRVCYAK